MEELIKTIAQTNGLAGILLALPLFGMGFLWKENRRLENALQKASQQTIGAHQQRVEDAQKISDKLIMMIAEQSSLNKETNLALERIGEIISDLRHHR